jgi:hypothetical protein
MYLAPPPCASLSLRVAPEGAGLVLLSRRGAGGDPYLPCERFIVLVYLCLMVQTTSLGLVLVKVLGHLQNSVTGRDK